MSEDEPVPYEGESRVSPPPAYCPHCDSLLPDDLGILECVTCSAQVKVEHFPTREAWKIEKVTCPSCRQAA